MTKAQVRKLETVLAEVQALQHEVKDYRIQKMLGDGKTDLLRALHALRQEYPAGIATLAEEQRKPVTTQEREMACAWWLLLIPASVAVLYLLGFTVSFENE